MELNIGEIIIEKRKEKGWTQEQLANAVGVSTPAVSKWETGSTYPDITLLSPIARALNISVNELLSYEKVLSEEKVNELRKKALHIYESQGFNAGWEFCQKVIQEYPNSIALKFNIGGLFQSFMLLKEDRNKEKIKMYYKKAAEIYEDVLNSGNQKYTYTATTILIVYYTVLDELDKAEKLLERLPKEKIDTDMLSASIYALRNKKDEAIKLTQEMIKRNLSRISQSLDILCAYAHEEENIDKAYLLAKINFEMTKLFDVKEGAAYYYMIKILSLKGDIENALHYFEEHVKSILELSYDYSNNPVFDKLNGYPNDLSYIKKVLAQSILEGEGYDTLKNEPRYKEAVSKLKPLVDAETNTFSE
ncbi:transcriptional repressor DicA [Oxobacter pfennigii]|uniref:Transcriptional repressor DicA n=1 Tax=Oxobacter pfennigii TaxID=36849 RepID=A0A0N8NTJ6_9CLOT|nr:helix-turn-helix transcriptional regulator [Oxobacter pfennigii]KPU45016.1 transcriptional repressor DicA [Oxobacter pfennigii]